MLNRYTGNYTAYVKRKEERFAEEFRAWEQQQAEIRREENFIKKHTPFFLHVRYGGAEENPCLAT